MKPTIPTQTQILKDFCYWVEQVEGNEASTKFQIDRLVHRWKACGYRVETLVGVLPTLCRVPEDCLVKGE